MSGWAKFAESLGLRRNTTLLLAIFCLASMRVRAQQPATLRLTKTISLPAVKGRFDHFAIDPKTKRLFVAALGNNTVEVLDTSEGNRLHTISGCSKPQGIAFLPGQNRLCVANGDDGTLRIYDANSFKLLKSFNGLEDADNVRYDARAKLIYVGYGNGALAILDEGDKKVGEIKLKAHPESFQLEENGNRIFVNVPEAKQIAVVDRETRTVVATWPMEKFKANFPMALDEPNHLLFVGCRQPPRLVVFSTIKGGVLADIELSGDTDDLFFNPETTDIYASCGEGFIDVVRHGAEDFARIECIPTSPGARTSFFSRDSRQFFLAVPGRGNQPPEIRVFEVRR
jgi:WD40 repeat protein